ncbi:hypothetical protein QFZ81_002904 [Paenibacillus sp. V4I9]|uniref:hypothetical protein n=1 Tax=Paenibacillus sp. V4I9 TaxID=3042308 RepID=UPI0027889E77|nr:hypothetical protein [Paenibacillus sp. V4I9]MDQ0887816.1 hypothetical protein [Paenibacillus sp. V4I9]
MNLELDKQFARKVAIMLKSRLIWYKHYFLFCDEVIEGMAKPPYWIIELADKKYIEDAIKIVNAYAFSEPFEAFPDSLYDFYVACLFIKCERKQVSWASFLKEAGDFADGYQAVKHDCEFFYFMLNDFEDSEYAIDLELKQKEVIKNSFKNEIQDVHNFYAPFTTYFRKYVQLQKTNHPLN